MKKERKTQEQEDEPRYASYDPRLKVANNETIPCSTRETLRFESMPTQLNSSETCVVRSPHAAEEMIEVSGPTGTLFETTRSTKKDPRDHQEAGTGVNKPISLASVDQLNLNSKQERTGDRGATEGRHDWKLKEQLGNVKGFLKRSHQKSFASTQGKKKFNKKKEKKHRKKRHKHRRGKDNVDQGRKDGKLVSSMHLTEHKLKRTTTVYQDGVWPCQKGHTIAEHIDAVDNLQTAYMEKSFLERIRNIIFCILSGSLFERNMHSTTGSGISKSITADWSRPDIR